VKLSESKEITMSYQENQTPQPTLAPINPQEFFSLHTFIKPKPEELRWTEIPWEIDLWEARQKAGEQNRPMFIWAMNGNPLGCT